MDQTAIKPGVPPVGPSTGIQELAHAIPRPARQPRHPLLQALDAIADLRITVFLFVLALLLVFWGTLAQRDFGIWTVVHNYFRSFFVWMPIKYVFCNWAPVSKSTMVIPFPGGWAIGLAMFINLVAAHAVRFKLTWNRA